MKHRRGGRWWLEYAGHGIVLLVLVALLFPGTFLRGEMISPGYLILRQLPWKNYAEIDWPNHDNMCTFEFLVPFTLWYKTARESLQAGEWPLWNPHAFLGTPLLAAYQSAVFYPPRLFHMLFDLHMGSTLLVLFKMWMCGFSSYVCARGLGLSRPASRFFSVAWMLCMFFQTWTYWCEPDVGAWFPIAFLGVCWLARGLCRKGFYTLALGGTMVLLAGHPESAFTLSAAAGLYFVLYLILFEKRGKAIRQPLLLSLGAWCVALLVCSVVIIPFIEYAVNSVRGIASKAPALSPDVLICSLVPRFQGMTADSNFRGPRNSNFSAVLYPGLAVWAMAMMPLALRRIGDVRRREVLCLLVPALLCVGIAFDAPFLRFVSRLPLLNVTWKVWFLPPVLFFLGLLAAFGFEQWFSKSRKARELIPLFVMTAICATTVIWLYRFHRIAFDEQTDRYVLTQLLVAGLFALLTLTVLLCFTWFHSPRISGALLTLVLVSDLLVAGRGLCPTTPRDRLWLDTQLTDFLRSIEPPPRVTSCTPVLHCTFSYYGIDMYTHYDALKPLRPVRLRSFLGQDIWNAMEPAYAIEYYLHPPGFLPSFPKDDADYFELVTVLDGIEVYRNKRAYPRAYLVGNGQVVHSLEDMVDIMRSKDYDPGFTALLNESPPGQIPSSAERDVGSAQIVRRTHNTTTVKAHAEKDCILVLADCFYPGWQASVDGTPVEVFPVYSMFRGILLPEGDHDVRFWYVPRSFYVGLVISAATLALSSALALRRLVVQAGKKRKSIRYATLNEA